MLKMTPPPPLELFRKFIQFGTAIRPLYQIIISVLRSRIIFVPETEDRGLGDSQLRPKRSAIRTKNVKKKNFNLIHHTLYKKKVFAYN